MQLNQQIVLTFYDEMSAIGTERPDGHERPDGFAELHGHVGGVLVPRRIVGVGLQLHRDQRHVRREPLDDLPVADEPRSLKVTADSTAQPGSLILVKYTAQCGDRERASNEGQAAIPNQSTPTPTTTP
ncbi:MAG: hypothetical protein R2692_09145 [Microbacterium sp.]